MSCSEARAADLIAHTMGILAEEEDAAVREHVASCESCRSDLGDYAVLARGFAALEAATRFSGGKRLADEVAADARRVFFGESGRYMSSRRSTTQVFESQRLKRAAVRKRRAVKRTILTALVVLAAVAGTLGGIWYLWGKAALDRHGALVERLLGVDLASLGLKETFREAAEAAGRLRTREDVLAMAPVVKRLIAWEFGREHCRPEALVLLELALSAALNGRTEDAGLIRSCILDAEEIPSPDRAVAACDVAIFRRVHGLWRKPPGRSRPDNRGPDLTPGERPSDDARAEAREALVLLVTEGDPLALYYSASLDADAGKWRAAAAAMESSAAKLPAVWNAVAWRWVEAGDVEAARRSALRAPAGATRTAIEAIIANHSGAKQAP